VHVGGAAAGAIDGDDPDAFVLQQVMQHPAALAGQHAHHGDLHVHAQQHACLPDPLTAGVQVHLGAVWVILDGHGQHGRGSEDHDLWHGFKVAHPLPAV
jgi:hypothetical protein